MKKCAGLSIAVVCAATLVLGAAGVAGAIDFKAKGEWIMSFDYGVGGNFMSKGRDGNDMYGNRRAAGHGSEDNFEARQRVRLQLDAVASENLSGTVFFEIGDTVWGQSNTLYGGGGTLGTDGVIVEVKRAYLDWIVPGTDLRVRMGLQGWYLPGFTFGNAILMEDGAGISAAYKFNDNVSLNAFWMRPYNDSPVNTPTPGVAANFLDNFDLFGLVLPLTFDGFKITPWVMGGAVGESYMRSDFNFGTQILSGSKAYNGASPIDVRRNLSPFAARGGLLDGNARHLERSNPYSTMFWAGLTGEVSALDPWRIAWDFNYGGVYTGRDAYDRKGWLLNALVEYKTSWGTPGVVAWWGSGDDGNLKNGSEVMPYVSIGSGGYSLSTLGFWGEPHLSNDGILGYNPVGTWGVGARIMDLSFLERLTHNIRVNFFQGTNDPKMAGYITGTRTYQGRTASGTMSDFNSYGVYLTSMDSGIEVNLDSKYQITENLDLWMHLGYIHLWLDAGRSMWGHSARAGGLGNTLNLMDAFRANIALRYSF